MTSFVTHLEGAIDGSRHPADRVQTLHKDRPMWVRYDLAAVGRTFTKAALRDRLQSMWRYRELLPLDNRLTLDDKTVDLLNWHFPLASLPAIARDPALPDYLQRRLVLAIWTRAVILKNETDKEQILNKF